MKINTDFINLNKTEVKTSKLENGEHARAEGGPKAAPNLEPQVGAAVKLIESKGYRLDEKSFQTVRDFMLNGEGTLEDKIEAIETVLAKDMPLKESLLSRLQGFSQKSLLDFLPDTLGFAGGSEGRKERSHHPARETGNRMAVSKPLNGRTESDDAIEKIEKIDELLRSLLSEIEKEGSSFRHDKKTEEDIEVLIQTMGEQSEGNLELLSSYIAGAASINESFSSRAVLMTKITPKLQELKQDFENLKRELKTDLMGLRKPEKPVNPEEAVKTLEKNIEKLDRAIMRSEMSLYMDLKGERQLLKLSSRLGEAREFLQNGWRGRAEEKLSEVLKSLEKLDYVPSIKKAMLLYDTGFERQQAADIRNMKGLAEWLGDRAARYQVSEGSASNLTNYMRKLGLGAEAEQFEAMSLAKNKIETEAKDFVNLKTLLRNLADQGAKPSDREAASQMLGRIEAVDLKNKILDTREPQSMSLELPLKLNGSIKSVKVFIQSPEQARKLDWENFNMFFVLTTERMGELGIKVEAVQRSLSVSILNDEAKNIDKNYDFKGNFKKEVEDLGFRLVKMILEEWKGKSKGQTPEAKVIKPVSAALSEEGRFDMSI